MSENLYRKINGQDLLHNEDLLKGLIEKFKFFCRQERVPEPVVDILMERDHLKVQMIFPTTKYEPIDQTTSSIRWGLNKI